LIHSLEIHLQAEDEYEILSTVQDLVEANYYKGKPLHHLPSARSITLEPGASTFFITEHRDFIKLSTETIQTIAKDRSIVVRNVPQPKFDWSLETLSQLGRLDQPREIQGLFLTPHCNRLY
jgi:hypothetical protein